MRVIVNTTPLIALERVNHLHVLRDLYGSIVRPQSVLDELLEGQERYGLAGELRDADWIVTEPDPPEMVLRKDLGAGETAAITLALRTAADLLVLDDLQARLVAESLGLRLTGTLGVLVAAHRSGILDDLGEVIRDLAEAGFHVSPELLAKILRSR